MFAPMKVSSHFDGGNIEIVDITRPGDAHLQIRRDSHSEFLQWFNFRVSEVRDLALTLHIDNAGETSYPPGWKGYRAVATYDRQHFFRVPTDYDGQRLTIHHTPTRDSVYYSYFAPYSHERHQDLIARSLASDDVHHELLGHTLDGRDMDLLTIGRPDPSRRTCWIVARQHPGETMAEWLVEGLLARLLDPEDPVARELRRRAVFHVVPNMNPDGSFRGNLRVNAAGANLNREWQNPTRERSPEVLLVRQRMEQTGVDFCLDVHGDEALPYNFIAGPDGAAYVHTLRLGFTGGSWNTHFPYLWYVLMQQANARLQEALNPGGASVTRGAKRSAMAAGNSGSVARTVSPPPHPQTTVAVSNRSAERACAQDRVINSGWVPGHWPASPWSSPGGQR